MITSANIQEKIIEFLSDEKKHSVQEMKAYLEQCGCGDYTEGQFAGSINTLLRNGSIEKIERGIYAINLRSVNMKKCFVVSPIGEDGSETRANADKLFKYIIKPVCEDCNFEAVRVDKLNDTNSITQTIIENLESADLVIADITEHNPNVFYEMGYRARTQRPIIHLKSKNEKLPFDVNTIRTFEYDLTDLDSVEEIKSRLVKTIETFNFSIIEELDVPEEKENISSSIMQVLFEISDKIDDLKVEMKKVNSEIIESATNAGANVVSTAKHGNSDDIMTTMLMEQLFKNPASIKTLMKTVNDLSKLK